MNDTIYFKIKYVTLMFFHSFFFTAEKANKTDFFNLSILYYTGLREVVRDGGLYPIRISLQFVIEIFMTD